MADPVIIIIARGENIVFHGQDTIRRHIAVGQLTGGLALPFRQNLPQGLFGILRNEKRIGRPLRHGIQLIQNPLEGKFGKYLGAAGLLGVAAHDKLIRADGDGQVFKNVPQSGGAAENHGERPGPPVRLGDQDCAFRLQLRPGGQKMMKQCGYSRRYGNRLHGD